jgi:serine/threonine protein kinase
MEFLEGETLAARLAKGPLPIAHAIQLAIQIVSALDKAHRAGIVHRDLTPANIFVVRSSRVSAAPIAKLLDFGLAKATTPATASTAGSRDLTGPGSIVGTVPYMAPEQIEGQEADARTDLFAFGSVLYEMISGRRAFQRDSQERLLAGGVLMAVDCAISGSLRVGRIGLLTVAGCITPRIRVERRCRRWRSPADNRLTCGRTRRRARPSAATDRHCTGWSSCSLDPVSPTMRFGRRVLKMAPPER